MLRDVPELQHLQKRRFAVGWGGINLHRVGRDDRACTVPEGHREAPRLYAKYRCQRVSLADTVRLTYVFIERWQGRDGASLPVREAGTLCVALPGAAYKLVAETLDVGDSGHAC